jgi:hypothetical protein
MQSPNLNSTHFIKSRNFLLSVIQQAHKYPFIGGISRKEAMSLSGLNEDIHRCLLSLEEWVGRQDQRFARLEALVSRLWEGSGTLSALSPTARPAVKLPQGFTSEILSDFRSIFDKFKAKHFSLLWRGSRDGFRANTFHKQCDGHAHTQTVFSDAGTNLLGGFTPG